MSESEIFRCTRCGEEHETMTQEIASYSCPKTSKPIEKVKMLDRVSLKYLTEINNSSETQDLKTNTSRENGAKAYATKKESK